MSPAMSATVAVALLGGGVALAVLGVRPAPDAMSMPRVTPATRMVAQLARPPRHQHRTQTRRPVRRKILAIKVALIANPRSSVERARVIKLFVMGYLLLGKSLSADGAPTSVGVFSKRNWHLQPHHCYQTPEPCLLST